MTAESCSERTAETRDLKCKLMVLTIDFKWLIFIFIF